MPRQLRATGTASYARPGRPSASPRTKPCVRRAHRWPMNRCNRPGRGDIRLSKSRTAASADLTVAVSHPGLRKATREDRKWPVTWVGVAGFEPAASSSRTSGSTGSLPVIPAKRVCCQWWSLADVRAGCCTSELYRIQLRSPACKSHDHPGVSLNSSSEGGTVHCKRAACPKR